MIDTTTESKTTILNRRIAAIEPKLKDASKRFDAMSYMQKREFPAGDHAQTVLSSIAFVNRLNNLVETKTEALANCDENARDVSEANLKAVTENLDNAIERCEKNLFKFRSYLEMCL